MVSEDGRHFEQTFSAGTIPPASSAVDPEIIFGAQLRWWTGLRRPGSGSGLERWRVSIPGPPCSMRDCLRRSADYAQVPGILFCGPLRFVFAIVVALALVVGWKLTRSITSAVGQLYEAHQAHQSRRFQPSDHSAVERPTGDTGQLLQFDDHVDREAGAGAKGKAAPGRRIGDCAGSAGAALSQVDHAIGEPGSSRVLPSGADGERGLLRFSGAEFRQADAGGGRHQRQRNFGGADDGDDPLGGARVQH